MAKGKRWGRLLALVVLGLVLACLAAYLGLRLSRPALDTDNLAGSWSSREERSWGLVDLKLMSDGTYEERLYGGMYGLADEEKTNRGTWSVEDSVVVLDDFYLPAGSSVVGGRERVMYEHEDQWELDVSPGLVKAWDVLKTEDRLRFTRSDDQP